MCATLEALAKVELLLLQKGRPHRSVALGAACSYAAVLAALRDILPHHGDHVAEHVRLFVVDRAAPLYLLQAAYE